MRIAKLKPGCSSGVDGIVAEHIKCAQDTNLIFVLLSYCFRFGIVPDTF